MKRIHSLPDLCLLAIFDRIPQDDLTRIGRVCPRWYSLEKSAFARRHHLSLYVYHEKPNPESNPGIQLKAFQHSTTQNVIDLFPNVTSLTIEHENYVFDKVTIDPLALVNLFTHQWSSKLVSLQLIMAYQFFPDAKVSSTIVESINNNLSSLKRLSLFDCFGFDNFKPQFRIISQLEEFYFRSPFDIDPVDWLLEYAESNTDLRRIELDTLGCDEDKVESLLKLSPQLAHKFTSLYANLDDPLRVRNLLLSRFCLHFSSLHRIYIGQCRDEGTFAKRLSCLSPLKQLSTLGLDLICYDTFADMSEPYEIEPFDSVNKLTLAFMGIPEKSLQLMSSFNFVYLFPKLEVVSIENDFYSEYDEYDYFDYDDGQESSAKQRERALHEGMIEPLMKCEHLREIEYRTDALEVKSTREN